MNTDPHPHGRPVGGQNTGASPETGHRPSAPVSATRADPHRYRHDLDGLRGLAIALVVIFHLWLGRVSGGVDVFLVLSGFFFTGMLLRRSGAGGGPSMRAVLGRTARRLLPALVVVLATTAAVTVLTRPFTQWSVVAEQLVTSLLYVQNWQLATTAADYQAADASVSPMQHLWSMSVQGQFYFLILIVVVILAAGCRRAGIAAVVRPVTAAVITAAGAVSLLYAAEVSRTHQGWAYYDTAARVWELLVGALLACVIGRVTLPPVTRAVLAGTGLATIVVCGLVVDGAHLFPGPAALIPVLATAAVILAGAGIDAHTPNAPTVVRFLAARPLVELGAIGYALYLWHWPVLIFYLTWRERPAVGPVGGLIVLAVSLVLARLTHVWVETPLRRGSASPSAARPGRGRPRIVTTVVTAAGAAVIAAAGGWQWYLSHNPETAARVGELDPKIYPGAAKLLDGAFTPHAKMRPTLLEAPGDLPPSSFDGCISDMSTRDVITCTYGDPAADRTLAVVGSSHAEHWLTALDTIGSTRGVRIVSYLKMGCPLTLSDEPMLGDQPYPDCRDWSAEVLDRLRDDRPDAVLSTATRPNPDGPGDITPDDYIQVWTRYADYGLTFLGLRDTPWLHRDGVPYRAIDCLAEGGDVDTCGMPRDAVLAAHNPALAPAAEFPLVYPLDLSDAVCDVSLCRVVEGNILIYHDSHHLSATYVRSLAPELDRQIGATTGWW
ncbi:acyltransferase [Rhodococcus sp. ZPP]|uniref:acyltransferase family protein n=1 Tax=Rhodococcus sp. ZPP TaxID=2749906 RepID=UPI001AD880BC|nr:acyltransferase family protein [Rhodococcus sp. ZPP]QTJ67234.1 acyltransferase [Rhodococcus sp. ZPP]